MIHYTSKIKMVAPYSIRAYCPVCGISMDNIIMWGSGALSQCSEDIEEEWPHQIDGYVTEKYKENGKVMVRIYNSPCAYPN